jgi:restriction system protein
VTPEQLPAYSDLILPTVRAVSALGGSAKAREITGQVLADLPDSDVMLTVTQPTRPEASVLMERIAWARSYAKLIGALESPSRGVFLLTPLGKQLLAMPDEDARKRTLALDREYRRDRQGVRKRKPVGGEPAPVQPDPSEEVIDESEEGDGPRGWQDVLLGRLHRLTPQAFEEFVLYLLRLYGLELERVGGSGDEGIDGIGTAPISPVLSSRVAVQVKRYDPNGSKPIARDVVALFQRDAQTKGAERAILVTLGKFSPAARKAATVTSPTVDLIDGERLSELILQQEVGVKLAPTVNEHWFDRFD